MKMKHTLSRWLWTARRSARATFNTDGCDSANSLLTGLYRAAQQGRSPRDFSEIDVLQSHSQGMDNCLPIPPPDLVMGYFGGKPTPYLDSGRQTAGRLRELVASHGVRIDESSAVLDWGATTGRVLRHFRQEAEHAEFWGVDVDEKSILWAQANLSPPFRFLTSSHFPHLPFPDNHFSLIYGLSVLTHIQHFRDTWIGELARITRPGGIVVLTIHDESTLQQFADGQRPLWAPNDLTADMLLQKGLHIECGGEWYETYTFYSAEYIRRLWGSFLDIVEIRSTWEGYQSAVIMTKR